jgi:hypothetical protein
MARGDEYARNESHAAPDEYAPPEHKRECNDVFFLIVWLAVIIMTLYFASAFGPDFVKATQVQGLAQNTGFKVVLKYVVTSAFAAMGMALVWIGIMICAGEMLIWTALIVIIVLNVAAAYLLTKQAYDRGVKFYYWPAIVFGLIALLLIMYTYCIRKRVKFAAAHLKVAGAAVLRLPMTLLVAATMALVNMGWSVAWIVGTVGFMFHQNYVKLSDVCTADNCKVTTVAGSVFGVLFGMLVVFFWGSFVLKNVIAVTVSGTVAAWKNASSSPFITLGAWLRAVTLNLGSICFGSLVVAILEAIRSILNIFASMASQSGNCVAACLLSCLSCIIGCLESWIEFFNRFAYTYVGCYGYSFITASKHVFKLFASKGWSAIVNDDLTNNVFFLGNVVVGAISAFIAVKMVQDSDKKQLMMFEHPDAIVAFFAFVVGYATNNLFMSVIASAVTTVFVLWAEDPQGWQMTRPDEYQTLHQAWLKIYPEEYNNGYGKQIDNRV